MHEKTGKDMNVIIFGATGGIGHALVVQAVAGGHRVTAFIRAGGQTTDALVNATIATGDVIDPDAVRDAVKGQDAVLCALGAPLSSNADVRARGTANIVAAMHAGSVRRLICVSALGVADSRDMLPWTYKYVLIPLFMRKLYADHALQEQHITQSGLDWTIVRPGVLSDGPRTGTYRAGFTSQERPSSPKISRADVADFMIRELTANVHLHGYPCLAY
ncbi:MAG: SDR family oxidoreductase [Pseudomonadota bacterium]